MNTYYQRRQEENILNALVVVGCLIMGSILLLSGYLTGYLIR